MAAWTRHVVTYDENDIQAFNDLGRTAQHFGLPLNPPSRIYSRFLDDRGCVRIPTKQVRRSGAFGHFVAFRAFAANEPEVWIWNERYWFSTALAPACMVPSQKLFREKFPAEQFQRIRKLAESYGLKQTCKTGPGLPDIAVFARSNALPWRFAEIKMPERNDPLRPLQKQWLELLTEALGPQSVLEVSVVRR